MNNLSDSHAAIYEEPVDERIRKFLKLENYFLKLEYHKELDTPMIHMYLFITLLQYIILYQELK